MGHPTPLPDQPAQGPATTQPAKGPARRKKKQPAAVKTPPAKDQHRPPAHLPAIYAAHYDAAQLATGLVTGELVRGVLRANPKNRSDAYVAPDESPSAAAVHRHPQLAAYDVGNGNDIYVCGDADRNRALNGDVVAIRILTKAQARASYRTHRAMDDRHHDRMRAQRRSRLDRMAARASDTSCSPTSASGSEDAGPRVPEVFGAVVGILCADNSRCFTGTLSRDKPALVKKHAAFARSLDPSTLWFRPHNNSLPMMALPAAGVPQNLYAGKARRCCSVRVVRWDASDPVPTAALVSDLGSRGSLESETRLILEENGVRTEPFSPAVLRCLPAAPWHIPARELRRRTDLRRTCVFTIDPPTARDLDDAVSCEALPNGNVLVGVHIADVSHFVRAGTALDAEARRRATTTYLVQKAVPMLPPMLCEDLCSLNPAVDRLAFSVMWEIDPASATVCATWFGRTVINSACKLAYDDAQRIIDGASLPDSIACFQVSQAHNVGPASAKRRHLIEESIRCIYRLSLIMRARRFANGALSLTSVRLSFDLDAAGNPTSCAPYAIKDSNRLIEEFMLLANMSVAARIEASFPDAALLRRHSPPLARRLDEVCAQLHHAGITIDPTSSASIQASLAAIADPDVRSTVECALTAPMQRAAYFCTHAVADPAAYAHYALSVPLYTHFTSPIRRYADVIVHRTLEAALAKDGRHLAAAHPLLPNHWSRYFPHAPHAGLLPHGSAPELVPEPNVISEIAHTCNLRKDAAKKAQDASAKLFAIAYLSRSARRAGQSGVFARAVITKLRQDSFVATLPAFGFDATIYMDRMADRRNQVRSTDGRRWVLDMWLVDPAALTLYWNAECDPPNDSHRCELADQMAALTIGSAGQSNVSLPRHSSPESVCQVLRVFDKITVYIEPIMNPPDLSFKLAMPTITDLV
ncbi:hypothetical protein FB645_004070 [Coemansia sp. IMI 203386]|nr:hypothetical protein FB645_004070 [Coemansia sp. IMI 203386]